MKHRSICIKLMDMPDLSFLWKLRKMWKDVCSDGNLEQIFSTDTEGVFAITPQHKNANFANFVLAMEFFLNRAELSLNSGNQINHWNMNWAQFKDPISHVCLPGTAVASWSLTQEVAGSSPFTVRTSIFVSEFSEFSEKI